MGVRKPARIAVYGALAAGAIGIALAIAALAVGADLALEWHAWVVEASPWWDLLLMPVGFGALAWITQRWFPGAEGGGVPQALAALNAPTNAPVQETLLSLRIALGKVALTIGGFACGASIGREGPAIQIGASILHAQSPRAGDRAPVSRRGLILAGAAAGVAATFITPLAGVVFAFEQMSRSLERRALTAVIAAVGLATGIVIAVLGYRPYFGIAEATPMNWQAWVGAVGCGLAGGLLGGAFTRGLLAAQGWLRPSLTRHPALTAAVLGLLVALVGIVAGGMTHGSGFAETRELAQGVSLHEAAYPVLKFAATLLSLLAGIPGGLFSPSLAVGAGLGAEFAPVLTAVPMTLLVMFGMAAYTTGVMHAPLTATVIVVEMFAAPQLALPLLLASVIALGVSRLISRESVYVALARQFTFPDDVRFPPRPARFDPAPKP
jgi:H+/Cl- antiporter ClcA